MEARASYRSSGISKKLVAFVLVILAVSIAVVAAYGASSLWASGSNVQTPAHAGAGTVLRQDNPPSEQAQGNQAGCVWINHIKEC